MGCIAAGKESAKTNKVLTEIPAISCCDIYDDHPESYTVTIFNLPDEDGRPHSFCYTVGCKDAANSPAD
jgi:hypothetical protein